ncbi:MAG TPA: translation initiation factor IF-2 [Flavobacteriaceae bacterium]|nr:translation initiation factor IF-2 [Ulvibacter sp.]HAH33592.1 translation initiation factor IF-2 [Flavobacteriaceae bacterium]|tara:strand:- start:11969 stop:14773 length:2805 start_codon:yes stop_codon:yes gene_type:complete
MAEVKSIRLNKVLKEFNISLDRAVDFLKSKSIDIEARPTTKISDTEYKLLSEGFAKDKEKKVESKEVGEEKRKEKEELFNDREREREEQEKRKAEADAAAKIAADALAAEKAAAAAAQKVIEAKATLKGPKKVGKIDLDVKGNVKTKQKEVVAPKISKDKPDDKQAKVAAPAAPENTQQDTPLKKTATPLDKEAAKAVKTKKDTPATKEAEPTPAVVDESVTTQYKKLNGPNFTGQKIDLTQFKKPEKKKPAPGAPGDKKGRRRRITKEAPKGGSAANTREKRGPVRRVVQRANVPKAEPTEEDIQKQVRETLEKLKGKSSKGKGVKHRREKRDIHRQKTEDELAQQAIDNKVLKVTEFVTASEVATMMDTPVTGIISACMSLGMMVTMNQRLDAETISIVAEEFGYEVEFITADIEESIQEVEDAPEDLQVRAPIVTVMGHVDHGKTSLLDYIREENVIAGESGGITQHIGAYGVELQDGQKMAFLDTPGHEAFTAMRARGAQVTDLAIIVVAADDAIMPQTKEAISHAQAAGVPIVFAINKIDKPDANPEKIKEQLAQMNLLVEDWGGKIQSHDISAKTGAGVPELLEKVLLEAELLELKANPDKIANGTIVEAFLDKGRGYVSTILVQGGTLKIGDYVLAGQHSGKVKAMHDERGKKVSEAGPSTPVSILGLTGAPQAGDKFNVFDDEREAKDIAGRRTQLQREQSVRTQRHITLDEIGRRIALGDFKELNIILKGDVDGSVEALTDSLQKLSTEEIQVNIIHKAVGPITESDVLLASASDAIIIGFNVRPMGNARQIADKEEIDIRTYSIIYAAINDLKDAMEGMLSPEMKEEITGTAEIRETFKISKVGTIAGCMVITGKIIRNAGIRLIREGVVIYTGELDSLKRFKDDAKEVAKGYDCGMQVKNYNDIKEGDVIESFHEIAVKKKLK